MCLYFNLKAVLFRKDPHKLWSIFKMNFIDISRTLYTELLWCPSNIFKHSFISCPHYHDFFIFLHIFEMRLSIPGLYFGISMHQNQAQSLCIGCVTPEFSNTKPDSISTPVMAISEAGFFTVVSALKIFRSHFVSF